MNTLPYPNNPNFVAALWAKVAATGGLKSEGNIKISKSRTSYCKIKVKSLVNGIMANSVIVMGVAVAVFAVAITFSLHKVDEGILFYIHACLVIGLIQGCKNSAAHLCHATKNLECTNIFFY